MLRKCCTAILLSSNRNSIKIRKNLNRFNSEDNNFRLKNERLLETSKFAL